MKKLSEVLNYGIGFLFFAMLAIGFFAQLLPDQKFSDKENRVLETMPSFSLASYLSGNFQESYQSYTNDQFPLRSEWVQRKTSIDMVAGIRKFQDVYIGDENILIQDYEPLSHNKSELIATSINDFYNRYPDLNTSVMIAPTKVQIESDKLPKNAPVKSQKRDMQKLSSLLNENIHQVDLIQLMNQHKKEYIYYKSDHHWTTLAAKYAFDAYLTSTGIEDKKVEYDTYVSNDNFYGTLANRIGYYKAKDIIQIFLPKSEDVKYLVNFKDTNQQVPSIYDSSRQLSTSPYEVFLGGNSPYIEIDTTVENDRHLLLFKDSYANCFVEFLLPYYSKITIIDPRYYYDDINELITKENVSDILYLYSADTIFSEDSLEQVINSK